MALVSPFRALRYDPTRVGDLAAVVAPPYDVISPAQQDALYARSPWNVVRLILPREPARAEAAAETLRAWMAPWLAGTWSSSSSEISPMIMAGPLRIARNRPTVAWSSSPDSAAAARVTVACAPEIEMTRPMGSRTAGDEPLLEGMSAKCAPQLVNQPGSIAPKGSWSVNALAPPPRPVEYWCGASSRSRAFMQRGEAQG